MASASSVNNRIRPSPRAAVAAGAGAADVGSVMGTFTAASAMRRSELMDQQTKHATSSDDVKPKPASPFSVSPRKRLIPATDGVTQTRQPKVVSRSTYVLNYLKRGHGDPRRVFWDRRTFSNDNSPGGAVSRQSLSPVIGDVGGESFGVSGNNFSSVVSDDGDDIIDYRNLLWLPGGVALGVVLGTMSYALMPLGDGTVQKNWWQCALICVLVWLSMYTAAVATFIRYVYMDCDASWVDITRKASLVWIIVGTAMFIIWGVLATVVSDAAGFYPFYFQGAFPATLSVIVTSLLLVKLLVPPAATPTPTRFLAAFLYCNLFIITSIYYWICLVCFIHAGTFGWWAQFFVFVFMFAGGRWIMEQISRKLFVLAVPAGDTVDTFSIWIISTIHVTFLSVSLGGADWYLTLLATASDLVMNHGQIPFVLGEHRYSLAQHLSMLVSRVLPCMHCVPVADDGESSVNKLRAQNTIVLLINEMSEGLMPIGYTALYVICYYGRNSDDMAGVGLSVWHLEETDLTDFLRSMLIVITLDMSVLAATFYAISGLEPFRLLAYLGETQGPFVLILNAFILYHQFCMLMISCGMDFSFTIHETHAN
uniref:Uncharacterized protein n=1 Tax=Phaeomonas parva TaxID=124430 RepID=A0A7S1UEZ1_9STRA|mmetsp:Transcript_41721/g.130704  ORF Transcript_41721/g.130704 Transcript_41721/m.130704 type:complete len:594 (+) Transcript_41721:253-2034(+)|eukprot:CAMPEP_0118854474 /NCGR_PEP_ID=MMETSP1163-20130328/2676_1 /TAXON_ID=124430 /ORGANISM="Phaeomonas parva, Strain CCMP2877" /LENGTH=593 /DNA_ID=CAMNT_0006787207 /DNA_START=208 /DNA_END=1989 /DNA_ORIENTATION=-